MAVARDGVGAVMVSRGRVERFDRSRRVVRFEMPIAEGGKSVLIFSPSPFLITAREGNFVSLAGNGEAYEGYWVYIARGFLDDIDRTENQCRT